MRYSVPYLTKQTLILRLTLLDLEHDALLGYTYWDGDFLSRIHEQCPFLTKLPNDCGNAEENQVA